MNERRQRDWCAQTLCGVVMWSVGSKMLRPVDRVTVEKNSEQMADVDEVLGQILFLVGLGDLQSDRSRRHLSSFSMQSSSSSCNLIRRFNLTRSLIPPLSVQLPLPLFKSQLQEKHQLLEPEEPTWLPLPRNNKELYTKNVEL